MSGVSLTTEYLAGALYDSPLQILQHPDAFIALEVKTPMGHTPHLSKNQQAHRDHHAQKTKQRADDDRRNFPAKPPENGCCRIYSALPEIDAGHGPRR
jgi:hypothetical protein